MCRRLIKWARLLITLWIAKVTCQRDTKTKSLLSVYVLCFFFHRRRSRSQKQKSFEIAVFVAPYIRTYIFLVFFYCGGMIVRERAIGFRREPCRIISHVTFSIGHQTKEFRELKFNNVWCCFCIFVSHLFQNRFYLFRVSGDSFCFDYH